MKRKALGKGLGSLIPQAPAKKVETSSQAPTSPPPAREHESQIDIDRVHPNPRQPRQDFEEGALDDLARSLKSHGVVQPIIVRPRGDGHFELVAGERRWRAAQRAGLARIPAIVRQVPDDKLLELALVENLQREELNAIEEALAYRTLVEDLGLTQNEAADRVGKQRATVANALRLLQLPKQIQEKVRRGRITAGHARAILGLPTAGAQIDLAERTEKDGLSVRQVEALVARAAANAKPDIARRGRSRRDPNVEAAEQSLQRALGTRVRIVEQGKGGRLELHYFGPEELERLYDLVLDAARRRGARAE